MPLEVGRVVENYTLGGWFPPGGRGVGWRL